MLPEKAANSTYWEAKLSFYGLGVAEWKKRGFLGDAGFGVWVGEAAGLTVMHCHCHVIPQYTGDVKEPQRFSQTRPFQLPTAALRAATLKKEAYSATLKCHDANGELYMPPFRSLSGFFMYYYRKNRGTMF